MRRPASAALLGLFLLACDGGPAGIGDIAPSLSQSPSGASVTTDEADYHPGETVTITGAGFGAGEMVRLHISEEPPNHPDWSFDVVANATGGFVNRQLVMDQLHVGVTFTLTATGLTSGLVAGTTFTDGNPQPPIVSVGQNPNPVAPGDSAKFTIQVPFAGNAGVCTVNLTAQPTASPAWPSSGVTFSFAPSSVDGNGGSTPISPTSELKIKIPATMAGGTYQFTATATPAVGDAECQGPAARVSAPIDFVVTANASPTAPTSLAQFKSNGTTAIPIGGGTNETSVVLKGVVSDPDAGNTVKLQVEVKPVGTAFTNVMTAESGLLAIGSTASVPVSGLVNGTSYHWQARSVDNSGAASAWASFGGGNPESDTDFYVDTTAPTVTINQALTQPDPTNTSPIKFTVVFNEAVTGFSTGDVTVTGTAGATTATVVAGGGPTTYQVEVTGMTGPGAVIANIAAGVASDGAGNGNAAATFTDNQVTYDATPPTVTINQAAGQADPTGTSPINFTVVFSEPITGFTDGDVTLSGTAGATTSVVSVGVGLNTYNVAVSGMTGTGTVIASIGAGVVQDLTGNPNAASTSTDHTVTYDKTPPVVTAVTASPNPTRGNVNVTLTATATDAITTVASAQYRIDGGGFTAMTAADGAFDEMSEGVTASIPAAVVGALTDGNHQLCVRATDAFGNTSDAADACATLLVDKTPPVVSAVSASPNPTNGMVAVTLTATATDALTNIASGEYRIDAGAFAAMNAADGGFDELSEGLTVTISAGTVGALSEGNHTLCVRATDQVGNTSADAAACTTLLIDKTPPVVSGVSASPNPANGTAAVTLTATATDALTNVASGEYRIDAGAFLAMSAADGAFDELSEGLTVTIPAATIAALVDGSHTLCVRATDQVSNRSADAAACTTLLVDKTPPVVSSVAAAPNPTNGTVNVAVTATATDALTNVTSAEYRIDAGGYVPMAATDGAFDELSEGVTATIAAATIAGLSEGNHQICVRATDSVSNTTNPAVCTTLKVDKSAPVVSNVLATPNPVAAGTATTISATISDATTGGSNVTSWGYRVSNLGYDSGWQTLAVASPAVTVNVSKQVTLAVGVYDVCVRGTDAAANTSDGEDCVLLAVYDPTAGFVTGGGWINSPAGASTTFPDAVGKATFGFVSKYKKGATVPEGETQFQFHAADLTFHSEEYQWLVVAGARAQYKGTGGINGQTGYGFMLTAIDGQLPGGGGSDRFRIKIWDIASGNVVYDNQMGADDSGNAATALGGGSIVIHAK